ncbi:MAG: spore coat protein [Tissierella sp.]|nr:spore coat protein [Tissierella sp.]
MRDQDIVNDVLNGTKASINTYTTAIQECCNQTLRSTLQTLRDEAEQMQYQIFQMAEQKGWYMPAPEANQNDVQKIKSGLVSSAQSSPNQNTNFTMK